MLALTVSLPLRWKPGNGEGNRLRLHVDCFFPSSIARIHSTLSAVARSVQSDDNDLITEFIVSLCLHNWESVRIWASMFYLHRNKGIFPSIVYKMIQAIHSYHIIFDVFSAHLCYRSCSSDILNGWFLIIFPTASDYIVTWLSSHWLSLGRSLTMAFRLEPSPPTKSQVMRGRALLWGYWRNDRVKSGLVWHYSSVINTNSLVL